MKGMRLLAVLVLACCFLLTVTFVMAEEQADKDKRGSIEKLVNEAYQLIQEKGEGAFNIIRDKSGKFNTKETYVFINDANSGVTIVNPAFQAYEGIPLEKYASQDERAAKTIMVNAVKEKGTTWVEYLWPKPNETVPSKKLSYVRKITINSRECIVGAGYYP